MKEPEKNIYTRKFSAEGRADVHKAKKHLESAKGDFMAIGAYGRAKDALYLMVSMSIYRLLTVRTLLHLGGSQILLSSFICPGETYLKQYCFFAGSTFS